MASSSQTQPQHTPDPIGEEPGRLSDVSRNSDVSRTSDQSAEEVGGSSAPQGESPGQAIKSTAPPIAVPQPLPQPQIDELDKDNPFEGDHDNDLTKKVREYSQTDPELEEYFGVLKNGALLAQDEKYTLADKAFLSSLSEKQKVYLEPDEKTRKSARKLKRKNKRPMEDGGFWDQSKYLKGSLLSACLAGIIQGWTQSAMNGANIGITKEFNIHHDINDPQRNTADLWLFGVLNAIPFLAGGLLAPFVSDPLQEHFLGRRGAIAVACVLSIAATVGQSFSTSVGQIIGCRIISGLTLAAKASSAPLLTAEVSPNHLRGNLLATWQLSDAFGIFLGFSSNLATLNIHAKPERIWRIQIGTILIPTIILLFLVYFMPESPRYLMKRGKPLRALDSFTMLRPSPFSRLLAARDMVYAHFQLQMECKSIEKRREERLEDKAHKLRGKQKRSSVRAPTQIAVGPAKEDKVTEKGISPDKNGKGKEVDLENHFVDKTSKPLYVTNERETGVFLADLVLRISSFFRRMKQTFNDARSRRALVCASTAMISQQLTGINTITFLSATLLKTVNASDRTGAWVGFGIGLCNFVFGAPAFWLLDSVGRATMLLLGFIPMFVFMLVLAFSFKTGVEGDARVPLVSVFGILFIIAYSPTAGTSPFAISAEVFPLVVREVGHSLAVFVNFFGLGLVLLVFPSMAGGMHGYRGALGLFAGLNLVALVLCFLFVPETKGRSLEELRAIFDIPTKEHINYRVWYVAPWLWRRALRFLGINLKSHPAAPQPTVNINAQITPTISADDSLRDFRSWWRTQKIKRHLAEVEAQAKAVGTADSKDTSGNHAIQHAQQGTNTTGGKSDVAPPAQTEAARAK